MTAASEPARIADTAWLTDGALGKLLAVLDRDGEEARVVGGAVRNILIGEPTGDIDVATTALPPHPATGSYNRGRRSCCFRE